VTLARQRRCENDTVYRDWLAFLAAFASLAVLRFFFAFDTVTSLLLLFVLSGAFLLLFRRLRERRL
jgi:membrane protein implicated in regulation of membrane protease activity